MNEFAAAKRTNGCTHDALAAIDRASALCKRAKTMINGEAPRERDRFAMTMPK